MSKFLVRIPGQPYPLKRARRAKNGRMFDPPENVEAKKVIGWHTRNVVHAPISGPVKISVTFWIQRPKSHFRKFGLKASAPDQHVQKPDVDNLIKAVLDGMNGIAWADDTQVVQVEARKAWCDFDPNTFVEISAVPSNEDVAA